MDTPFQSLSTNHSILQEFDLTGVLEFWIHSCYFSLPALCVEQESVSIGPCLCQLYGVKHTLCFDMVLTDVTLFVMVLMYYTLSLMDYTLSLMVCVDETLSHVVLTVIS